MWLVEPFFKNMWAGPLSTTSLINNLLPGCCVDKLSSFHHPCHPHLLPSPTHARTSKFIYQAFLGGRRWAGGRKKESDCSKNQNLQLKPSPFLLHVGTHRNWAPTCFERNTKVSMDLLRKSWTSEILQDFLDDTKVDWNPPRSCTEPDTSSPVLLTWLSDVHSNSPSQGLCSYLKDS